MFKSTALVLASVLSLVALQGCAETTTSMVTGSSRLQGGGAPSTPASGPGANSTGSVKSETARFERAERVAGGGGVHAGRGLGDRECVHCGK